MIPRPQHFGDRAPFPCNWSGIVRIFQETLLEALLLTAGGRAHYPGEQPYASIEDDHRAKLSAREHVVANRNRLERARTKDALIDSFKATAEQDHPFADYQFARPLLTERPSSGRQSKHWASIRHAIESGREHVRPKHHAGSAACRRVVNATVLVRGEITNVRNLKTPDALTKRATGKARTKRSREHVRVERQDCCAKVHFDALVRLAANGLPTPPAYGGTGDAAIHWAAHG